MQNKRAEHGQHRDSVVRIFPNALFVLVHRRQRTVEVTTAADRQEGLVLHRPVDEIGNELDRVRIARPVGRPDHAEGLIRDE